MARPSGSSPFAGVRDQLANQREVPSPESRRPSPPCRYVPPRKVREAGRTVIVHLHRSVMLTRRTPRDPVMTSGLGR